VRLILVSNRLPVVLAQREDGTWEGRPGSGGLVTALRPVLQNRGGTWVGWAGSNADTPEKRIVLRQATREAGYSLRPVDLTAEEHDGFYRRFANEAIWPLFHDLPWLCRFDAAARIAADAAVRRFALAVAELTAREDDFVWVHDYHFMGAARAMRELGVTGRIAFFLHTPFPSLDLFLKLPWRFEILRDLLEYDLIGVQTLRDRRNLLQCLRFLHEGVRVHAKGNQATIRTAARAIRIGAFPIGIDFREFADLAASADIGAQAEGIRADEPNRSILLGVDRLDYTKGLPHRLEAFARALEAYPDLLGTVTLVQFVVPSREDIAPYAEFKRDLERQVGEINGRFTRSGWVPVHYAFRALDRDRLLAWYRAADVALVTPLKDGMNLVAKEYCAANPDGVLVLSEFAGAAAQLQHGALLVNPYDVEGTAAANASAVHMGPHERRFRMRKLRRSVREHDIYWWLNAFLSAAVSKDLQAFPVLDDFVPRMLPDHELSAH
jgi:trehalose 6-phosphate synthase/phosphatase